MSQKKPNAVANILHDYTKVAVHLMVFAITPRHGIMQTSPTKVSNISTRNNNNNTKYLIVWITTRNKQSKS